MSPTTVILAQNLLERPLLPIVIQYDTSVLYVLDEIVIFGYVKQVEIAEEDKNGPKGDHVGMII